MVWILEVGNYDRTLLSHACHVVHFAWYGEILTHKWNELGKRGFILGTRQDKKRIKSN